jgi:phosphoribosylanthranilate isomerase
MKRSGNQESRTQNLDLRLCGEEKKKEMKLKVCGMRNTKNIAELIQVQPDFIGFIFHEKSSRNVTNEINVDIPSYIQKVGVFVDVNEQFITSKINNYNLNAVQLHGLESPQFCEKIRNSPLGRGLRGGLKVIKAFNIHPGFDFELLKQYETFCDYFLFDAFGEKAGGNGVVFNWDLLNYYTGKTPFLLSGGIDETMANQIKKIKHSQFAGIDINSRFEIEPSLKNIEKIKKFKTELTK